MEIIKFSLGQLQANCYFLIEEDTCLIVDPADEASFILEELQRRKLKLIGMLATHGHFDHVMAAGEIQMSMVETSRRDVSTGLHLHKKDQFLVERLKDTAKYFLGYDPNVIEPKKLKFIQSKELKIKNFKLKIIFTPGHTPGSVSYYYPQEKIVFTGDTLFKGGIGRYDFSYSNKSDLKKSLETLLKLPGDTLVYPGHEEKTKISSENLASTLIY